MPTLLSVSIQWPLAVRRRSGDNADMADDKTKTSPQDASRINVHEPYEVEYWSKKFRVTPERLKAAVAKVGVSATAVEKELGGH